MAIEKRRVIVVTPIEDGVKCLIEVLDREVEKSTGEIVKIGKVGSHRTAKVNKARIINAWVHKYRVARDCIEDST